MYGTDGGHPSDGMQKNVSPASYRILADAAHKSDGSAIHLYHCLSKCTAAPFLGEERMIIHILGIGKCSCCKFHLTIPESISISIGMREHDLKILHKILFQPFSVQIAEDVAYSIPALGHVLAA